MATVEDYIEALTPSGDTKAEYIGEFRFTTSFVNDDGDEEAVDVTVPWDTTKQIMKAIRERAERDTNPKPKRANKRVPHKFHKNQPEY